MDNHGLLSGLKREIMIIQAISIKTIGGNPLFEDLSCQIEAGEKLP